MRFLSTEPRYAFLTARQWRNGLVVSGITATVISIFTVYISVWVPISLFAVVLTVWHMTYASRFIVPFPHVAILLAALQYIFAPWASFFYPSGDVVFDIGANLPAYLGYAGPVVIVSCLGWFAALVCLPAVRPGTKKPLPRLLFELDALIILGFVAYVVSRLWQTEEFAFALQLFANLRFVGVSGRVLVDGKGWRWRLAALLTLELLGATGSTMFHDLLLWSIWSGAVLMYRFTPSLSATSCCLVAIVVTLPSLQFAKTQMRSAAGDSAASATLESKIDRVVDLGAYFASSVAQMTDEEFGEDFIADAIRRYNQGGVINRVMLVVPDLEPFAEGQTIKDAAVAALAPRFIFSQKLQAGGRENMLRYAAMDIGQSTSINLGYAGEMYANFGWFGGIIGSGVYTLAFGLALRAVCRLGSRNAMWWMFVPFVAFAAVKAEEGVAEVFNASVKSCLVAAFVYFAFPAIRRALLTPVHSPDVPIIATGEAEGHAPKIPLSI